MKKLVKKAKKVESIKVVAPIFSREEVKEKISELRVEMTHSVVESMAVSMLAFLLFIGAPSVFPEIINPYLPSSLKIMQAIVAVPTIFWLVAVLGNMVRYFRILKLSDLLSSKK